MSEGVSEREREGGGEGEGFGEMRCDGAEDALLACRRAGFADEDSSLRRM